MDAETTNRTRLLDLSGRNNHAVLVGAPPVVAGRVGQALNFNGSTAASAAVDLSVTSIITLSFWMNWTTNADDDALVFEYTSNYNSNNAFIVDWNSSTGAFDFGCHSSGAGAGHWVNKFTRPSAGVWHHVVLVMDRAAPANAAYVDGTRQSLSASGNDATSMGPFDNSTLYFMSRAASALFGAGSLDDVRIYNRSLSTAEVLALYTSSFGAFQTRGRIISSGGVTSITGTLAVTEANDTISATGGTGVGAALTRTEANDTIAASGGVAVGASLAVTEALDTISAAGNVAALGTSTGTLAVTEAPDTIVAAGTARVAAALAVTEAADTIAAAGAPRVAGALAVAEGLDALVASGLVLVPITGALARTEAPDTLAAAGNTFGAITGALGVTEQNDTLVATGHPNWANWSPCAPGAWVRPGSTIGFGSFLFGAGPFGGVASFPGPRAGTWTPPPACGGSSWTQTRLAA